MNNSSGTPHSQRSWLSVVLEIDPDYQSDWRIRSPEYRFNRGDGEPKRFRQVPGYWYANAGHLP
jgi:hypothetical protein